MADSRDRTEAERGTSWVSVIIGWLAATGASLLLSGIIGAVVGAIVGGSSSATAGGILGLVGLLVTLLLGFLVGGYAAGRMASRSGVKHGLLVALLALVVAILLALVGAAVGGSLLATLGGGALSQQIPGATSGVPQPQGLGTILTVSGILALLFMFVGGAIGGVWGARVGRRRT